VLLPECDLARHREEHASEPRTSPEHADDWRIRAIGGLFWEKYQIQEQVDWFYETATPYFNPIGPPRVLHTERSHGCPTDIR